MIRVMCFGTFDRAHQGHEYYLSEAKKLGDSLIAVVAKDETVKLIKGHLPDQNEEERKKNLENLGIADKVIIGNLEDKYDVIRTYRPEIIALGYDQYAFTQMLNKEIIESKMNTKIVRIPSFKPEIFKSSIIKLQA